MIQSGNDLSENFKRSLAKGMVIAGSAIIPPGLVVSSILCGWKGFAGAFAGFTVASIHSLAFLFVLDFGTRKPEFLSPVLGVGYFIRIAFVAGSLYGLHFIKALNMYALLGCFLALFISHSAVEIFCTIRTFGVIIRGSKFGGAKKQ
ncbi:MAG: hypothetical protein PHP64_02020 [Actinomycetota bacterium]|nr:hypothetical protein [Actinomycetota bacterium]